MLEVCLKYVCGIVVFRNLKCPLPSSTPSNLEALKKLDLSENKLKTVPGELANCARIKGRTGEDSRRAKKDNSLDCF